MTRQRSSLLQPLEDLMDAAREIASDVAVECRHLADVGRRGQALVRGLKDANTRGVQARARRHRHRH